MEFIQAQRKQAKLRLGIISPSGGGKTHSALLIAGGIGGNVALIDTEHGSASLEVGKPNIPDFSILELSAPFAPKRYIEAIKAAETAGFQIVIIDSLSHAWASEGGVIDIQEQAKMSDKMGNAWTAWRKATPEHNKLIEAMLQSSCHIIATMRSKVEYVQTKDDSGKVIIKKVGLQPVQREGMDYEFTIVFDLDKDTHTAVAGKDRTSLFDNKPHVPTVETGRNLLKWLNQGVEAPKVTIPPTEAPPVAKDTSPAMVTALNAQQRSVISALHKQKGLQDKLQANFIRERYKLSEKASMTYANAKDYIEYLNSQPDVEQGMFEGEK